MLVLLIYNFFIDILDLPTQNMIWRFTIRQLFIGWKQKYNSIIILFKAYYFAFSVVHKFDNLVDK